MRKKTTWFLMLLCLTVSMMISMTVHADEEKLKTIYYTSIDNILYSMPDESSTAAAYLQQGDYLGFYGEIQIDSAGNYWHKVKTTDGVWGWVKATYNIVALDTLEKAYLFEDDVQAESSITENDPITLFYVNPINDYINVRSLPAHDSALVGTVQFNETMYFYGESSTGYGSDGVVHYWYKIVSSSGVTGWVRSDLVSTVPNNYSTIYSYSDAPVSVFYVDPINSYINVRSQPSHDSALVGTVQIYEVMYFYGETGTGYGSDGVLHYWYKIVSNAGVIGWVRSDLVSAVATASNINSYYSSTAVTILYVYPGNDYLNIRTQPTHYSNLAGTVDYYENMYFYGESATGLGSDGYIHLWYKVTTARGVTGWVRSDLVGTLYYSGSGY